ncbi:MAG: hypothetical protein SNG59_06415 [Rikenellaceae bacterium]
MKNLFRFFALAAIVAVGVVSCQEVDGELNNLSVAGDGTTIYASIPTSSITKISFTDNGDDGIALKWELDDTFTVTDATNAYTFVCTDATTGAFTSTTGTLTDGVTYTATYGSKEGIYEQDGDEINDLDNACYMLGEFTYSEGSDLNFTFEHQMAVVTFTFESAECPAKLVFENGEDSYTVSYSTIEPVGTLYTSHIMINPCEASERTLIFSLYDSNDTAYDIRTTTTTKAYVAGMRYTAAVSDIDTYIAFEDDSFRDALLAHEGLDINGDGAISYNEAAAYTGAISVSDESISSMDEIKCFTSITTLTCYGLSISSLDLSANTELTYLNCNYSTSLSSLDLSANTELTRLSCSGCTSLSSLDLSANTELTYLHCGNLASLSSLDLSANTELTTLYCYGCALSLLDLSKNTELTYLNCGSCASLSSLDLSNNTKLTYLGCGYSTSLSSLDLSANTELTTLSCYGCTSFSSLDLSANTELTYLSCPDCTSLSSLDLSANTELTTLSCYGCTSLSSLDLSANTELTTLSCYGCTSLSSLDLSASTELTDLNCYNCALGSLDLSENTKITTLYCYENAITELTLPVSETLTDLRCYYNRLTTLDVSICPNVGYYEDVDKYYYAYVQVGGQTSDGSTEQMMTIYVSAEQYSNISGTMTNYNSTTTNKNVTVESLEEIVDDTDTDTTTSRTVQYKSDLYMDVRSQIDGATATSFLDLSELTVYQSCVVESENLLASIDVIPYHKGLTYMQLRSPSAMSSTLKNFQCAETGNSASSFEGTELFYTNYTYYYGLDVDGDTYPAHKTFLAAFLDAVSADDGTAASYLSTEYFDSIDLTFSPSDLTTGTYYGINIYESGTYTEYPDLNYASPEYPYIVVYNIYDNKYGLIKINSTVNNGETYMVGTSFDLWY